MWGKALEIASRMTLPIPVVSFALVFAAFVFRLALRSKTRGTSKMFLAVSLVIVVLGLAPLAASALELCASASECFNRTPFQSVS